MAANRLLQTLFILLERGSTTAPELARQFEVSVRTIYRDLDQLSAAGIPVYATQGKGGGIFLEQQYVLNKSLLSEHEQEQILMALQGLGITGPETGSTLLGKLGGMFQKQHANWIEVDFSDWRPGTQDTFSRLQHAIFQNKVITFTYYGEKSSHDLRTAEPLKLVFKSQNWYLYAYCRTRQDYRIFKLSRIKDLQITVQDFVRSAPELVFEHARPDIAETVKLTLHFSQTAAYRIYDNFEDIEETGDGGYLVRIALPHNESLYRFLLSFGDSAEVLEPPEVRRTMKRKILNMQNNYNT